MKALLKALVVIFLSGLCYYFGENFDFHWFLIWLAPIPVLVYAYREGFWKSLIVAYVVGLAPGLNMFLGYMPTGLPPVIFFSDMFSQSLSWTAVILLARFMMRRHPSWMMVFAFPALLSLSEWLLSLTSQGTFGTIANSQLPVLAVVQIASLTGFFGVTFIVSLFGSALAYLIVFYTRKKGYDL